MPTVFSDFVDASNWEIAVHGAVESHSFKILGNPLTNKAKRVQAAANTGAMGTRAVGVVVVWSGHEDPTIVPVEITEPLSGSLSLLLSAEDDETFLVHEVVQPTVADFIVPVDAQIQQKGS
jgi:hypothetical protein